MDVDRWRLKFPADPKAIDLMFVEPGQVSIATEFNLSLVRLRPSGDQVEHRALPRAVWADDDAQLTFVHVESKIRDGFEPFEALVHILQREDEIGLQHRHLELAK